MNLQEYKRAYPQFSEWDDEVLVNRLYREEGRKAGLSFDDFSKAVGFAPEPEVTAKPKGGFVDSLKTGAATTFKQLPQLGYGLASVGAASLESMVGEGGVATALKQGAVDKYLEWSKKIQADHTENYEWDVAYGKAKEGDINALVDFLGYGIGYGLGQGAQIMASAGVGAIAAKTVGRAAVEKMASGMIAKEVAEIGATEAGKKLAANEVRELAVSNVAAKVGREAALAVSAVGMEGGEIGGDLVAENRNRELTGSELVRALGATTLAGAFEYAGDRLGLTAITGKLGLGKSMAGLGGRAVRGATGAIAAAPGEFATEYMQTGAEEWGKGKEENIVPWNQSAEAQRQAINAGALGAVGGGAMGAIGGAISPPATNNTTPDPDILNAQTADEAIAIAQERVSADLTSAVTDYQSLFASAAPSGSFDQLVQNELNPVAATQLGEDQALQNYLRDTDTDTLVRDLVHADQASFERIVGGLSERAADMVLNDISSALRSATDEQLAQSPGWAAQIEMQRRRELQTAQAYSQQSEQQIAADRQKAYESGQIAEQARDQQVDLQTTISQVNEAPAAPTVMEQAMAGAQQGPSKQEQLRLEQARIRQQLQQTRDANRTQAAQLADNEAGNFSTARQARPADGETAPLSAPANNTENAKSLSRMMNGAPVADVTVQALAGKFDSIPRLMAQTVQKLGKALGRQVVFFEGGIADGAAPQMRDDKRIFINIKQGAINPLSILGHEMMHRMRIESPKAYQTLVKAVRDSGIITDEMLADYDADYNSKDYADLTPEQVDAKRAEVLAKIKSDKKTADFLLEEMLSDLNGNRFTEADFWTNVFQKIEEREGREAAKPIIARLREALVMAINRLMTATKTLGKDGKFGADQQIMDHLGEVKSALEEAFATYMQEMKDGGSGQLSVQGAENRGQAQRTDMAGGMADAGLAGGEPAGRGGVPAGAGAADPEAGAAGGEGGGGLRYSKSKPATYSDIKRGEKIEQAEPLSEKQWAQVREIALEELSGKDGSRAVEAERDYLAAEALANRESERYKEVAREKLGSMATPQLSTVPVMEGKVKPTIVGTGKNNKTRVFDVARVLRKRILARAADITTVEGRERVARAMVHEALYSLSMDGHAVGWYDRKVREALAVTAMAHPEILTNKEANLAFRVIAAVTSNGQAVRDNFILANEIYKTWRAEGRFPVEFEGGGTRAPAMKVAFAKMNFMSEKYGWEKTERELMTLRSVRDIEQSFELKISGELKDALVPTAVGLGGPKIGNFFANLSGYFDSPTMDLWFMRTIGRMTGGIIATKPGLLKHLDKLLTLLPEKGEVKGISVAKMRKEIAAYKALPEEQRLDPEVTIKVLAQVEKYGRAQYAEFAAPDATGKTFTKKTPENENARSLKSNLSALVEAPGNGTQRDQLRQVVKRALSMLDKTGIKLNAADLQAVLWYYEKNLYAKLGDVSESAKPWDYASAARFGVGREYGLVDVGSSKRAGQVRDGESGVYEDDAGGMDEADGEADAKLSKSRVIFEVAPDPNNEQLTAAWNKLSSKEKLSASEYVANKIIPKILAKIGASGTMSPQIGGYMGESNPSFTISLESGNPDAIAKSSGFVLSQDMMIAVSDKPFDGGSETGAITIDIGIDDPADVYAKIFEKVKQAEGHTTVGGQMIIINNPDLGIALSDLARQVDAALGGKYDVYADDGIYASFPMKEDYGYGSDNQEQSSAGSPDSQWAGELRAEANDLLKQELAARGIKLSLTRSDAGSAQRAGAVAAEGGGEVRSYGTAAPGAIAVQGFHYSTAERSQLDGRYYGTGTKGAEYPRVMSSRDPRIKERIYFYVDAGRGITPEQGVGSVGHTVNLNNVYDGTNDTWLQAKISRDLKGDEWMNAFESAVIDNGFDGYVSDFGTQRAAVLLGRHSVKVQPTQTTSGAVAESKPAQENAGADAVAKSRVLPGGKMSGADWKRMVPAVVPGADVSMLEDGKDYYKDDVVAAMRGVKYSLARSVESSNGLPNQADGNRTLDGAELKALRRAAANLERPRDGVFLRVTEDGKAIATGPKGIRVPDRFIRFAEENGLAFEARRDGRGRQTAGGYPMGGDITSKTEPMPVEYRESGAMYFGEGNVFYDRTGMSRFSLSRTPSASAQKEIAAIEERLAKSPSDFVAKNLENIKRGLAGEVVRDENGNLLAPNGRKSKLTEQQYLQVRTPEFMNWFGDWLSFHNAKNGNGVWEDDEWAVSKVVDENGEPMVVYHGSEKGGFRYMRPEKGDKHRSPMIFAAKTRETARSYSGRGDEIDLNTGLYEDAEGYDRDENDYDLQRGVYSLFLNIRNPHEADFEGANWDGQVFDKYEVKTPGGPWDAENIYGPNGERFMDYEMAEQVAGENNGEIHDAMDLDENTNSVAEEAKRYGNDGAIIRSVIDDGGRGGVVDPDDVFVIFDSNQAKSATQNVGTFSTTNDDLRYSPARNILGNNLQQAWSAPNMGKMDDFIYTMQDKQVDMKRVIESIKAAVGSIADKWNPYLKEELFHGRSAKGVKDFMDFELRPLLQEMKMRGVEMAEFEKYLHNRHAEERNRQVARVNPNMPDAGSGIKTADARAYMAALDPQKRQRLDALARRIDAITSSTLDLLEREGLETPQTIAKLRAAYKYYVPLKRDMGGDGLFGMGTGQGYSVRGASSKRAMGSEKDVVDILANIAMQRERAIVRVEKNRVAQALYGLAIQNPNGEFWAPVDPGKNIQQTVNMLVNLGMNPIDAQGVAKEQKQRYIDPRTGLVAERINPVLRNADNVLAVRINGEDKYLFFSETDARAQRMVHALKNLDADQLGRVMSIMGKATRYFASINTQYNPIFGIINIIRDAQGALLNLSTTPIAGKQKEVLGNTISAMRGIYADIRDHRKGRVPSSQWAQLWEEFQQVGGQTGYKDMFSRSEERAEALEKELKKIGEGKLKAAGRAIFDWLSDYNETLENATRLAAYKVAKDQGMSNDQAASLAKNLTVNFNRKGQVATQAGAMYAFFNANVQGTARLVETLKGKSGKKIITGGLLLGSMQAVLLAMAGYDDDEPPAFVRERNLILPLGDHYLTLPMPLGFHVIPSMARIPTEFVLSGFKNPTKRIGEMFGLFADTFNPIGGAGISLQTIAPTVVDPFAALAENRDWTGKQIAKMDRSSTDPTPGHARAKDTASEFSKVLSSWINAASGGTKYKQGLISPTPDQLDYLIGQATGGVGREYLKAEQVATSAATGEELPLYKVPLLGRFVGETQGQGPEGGKFYSAVTRLNEHEAEIKGLRSEGKFAEAQAYIAENPEASMVQMANAAERRVADLRKQKRQLLERDASPERIKLVEQQITATMRRFNEQVKLRAEQ